MRTKEKKNKDRLPHYWRRSLSWTAYIGSNGIQSLLMGYMSFYLTESVLLSAATVGTIIALSRVFDGISDIIAGFIIDKTNTRWGKARPYSLFSLVMWIAVVLLFSVPDLSNIGKIVYVFIIYNLSDTVARTFLFAAESVHYKSGFTSDEQLDVVGFSGLISGIVSMVVGIVTPLLISTLGATKPGWTIIAVIYAIPCAILGVLKLFLIPEVDVEQMRRLRQENKVSLKNSIKALFGNRYIFLFEIALLLRMIIQGMGVPTYYFKYIVGDVGKLSVVNMVGLVSMVLMPLLPVLTRKLGVKNFVSLFLFIGGASSLLIYINPTSMPILAVVAALNLLAVLPISMLMTIVAIQCMKYTEWKSGVQIDGLISSMNGVSQKVGMALGAILVGFALSASGYDGSLVIQTDQTLSTLKFLYAGFPAILLIAGAGIMQFYTLEKKMPKIEADLGTQHKQRLEE